MLEPVDFEALPGGDLVRQGLADLRLGVELIPALLVLIGGPQLRRLVERAAQCAR